MEDLQDACEDSQFVNAMSDGPPLPTAEFILPLPAILSKWQASRPPGYFDPTIITSQRLGFFLFMRYVRHAA